MTQAVRISLQSFVDYVNVAGPRRADLLEQQVERYIDKTRSAWWPYLTAERRCIEALGSDDPDTVLEKMVGEAPSNMTKHYPDLRDGLLKLIKREAPRTQPIGTAVHCFGDLTIKVNHVVGLDLQDGRRLAALLYYKQPLLTSAGSRPALRILQYKIDDILPDATPAVLDVRRAKLITMPRNVDLSKLDRLLVGDAAGYLAHWQATVAA
jgi:hypothetical protein